MNSQTKQRYISTSIWSDDWFDSLSEREKLVYFYLLTNEHTNPAGVYQCTLKNVRLEIGLSREEIERIMAKFAEDGKAFYFKEYIIIPKWLKHQKVSERNKIFLGAISVLKSLPDEVKRFIADRSHYDFDIQKYIEIQPDDGPLMAYPENDPQNGWPIQKTDKNIDRPCPQDDGPLMAYPENDENSAHDLDLDLEFNINTHEQIFEDPPPEKGRPSQETFSSHFIQRWQQNADVFNCLARLKRPSEWQAFWEQNTLTLEQIDLAIENFIAGVKSGAIERRFVPSSPDGFVLNGWLQRSAEPFKKQGQSQRIANDNVADDDIDKYFREA